MAIVRSTSKRARLLCSGLLAAQVLAFAASAFGLVSQPAIGILLIPTLVANLATVAFQSAGRFEFGSSSIS